MSRFAKQVAGMIMLLVVGVFIGMEVTSVSIERIYGPVEASRNFLPVDTTWPEQDALEPLASRPDEPVAEPGRKAVVPDNSPQNWPPKAALQPPVEDTVVNKLADQTAGLLQTLSEAGIRAIVGLFDGLF